MAKQLNNHAPDGASVSRPGIHAKTKTSKNKDSKNYKKSYRGQGK